MPSSSRSRLTSDPGLVARAALALALLPGCRGGAGTPIPASGAGDTTVYLSEPEALRVVFPEAARVVKERVILLEEERRAAEAILQGRLDAASFTVHAGITADGRLDGYALILWEIGKFKPFHFIVGIEPDGSVRRVAVLVYRESRGGEVARRRFLTQYEGKSPADPLRTSRDIINISGATMSVTSLNRGVRKALAVVDAVYARSPERVRALLERGAPAELAPPPGTASPAAHVTRRLAADAGTEVREARYVMGSVCEIRAWGRDPQEVRRAVGAAFSRIEEADRLLSDYREDSELSTLSRGAGGDPARVSDLTARFLIEADRISRASRGAFDITVGPLVCAWGFRGKPTGREPSSAELEALRPRIDHRKVLLSRGTGGGWEARLELEGMRLDPGGLGKGFAVDLAGRRLVEEGVRAALVDFSGNMLAIGAPPGSDAWDVAVRDPARPDEVLGIIRLRDRAVSSSGSYESFVVMGGARLGHILSPRTLRPVSGVHGAVTVASTAAAADGWSTAAHVLGADAVPALAAAGVEGFVSLEGGRAAGTPGWGAMLRPALPEVALR